MPSSFHGIEMASRALRAFQRGLDVTGHNIANVNTRGFSRQTIEYSSPEAIEFYSGMHPFRLGQGVHISSVNRIQDMFLQGRMFGAQGGLGRFESLSANLSRIEPMFGEPGTTGISAAMNRFFNAWSGLSSNPSEPSARLEVQLAGSNLSSRIRTAFHDLSGVETELKEQMSATFGRIDGLASEIAELNAQIRQSRSVGGEPNDLLDARDLAIEELSRLADVQVRYHDDGSATVHSGSFTLVADYDALPIPRTYDAASFSLVEGTTSHPVRDGKLHGLMEALNSVASYKSRLDDLANNLREQVNAVHVTGLNPNATTGVEFFNTLTDPPSGAIDFDLSSAIKADPNNIAASITGNAGDGGLALALSNLRDASISGLGQKSFGSFYSELIGTVATHAAFAESALGTQTNVVEQIDTQRQSVRGVSLDDEMAAMLRMQRSYQAAARTLSVFDEVTEDLINLIR